MNKTTLSRSYFEIDFLKFVLMFGMVLRHAPLMIFDKPLVEYSTINFDYYSFFIPVTSGFTFILGLTLGASYTANPNKINLFKYMKMFGILFFLSLLLGLISFLIKAPDNMFFTDFFFRYEWNSSIKPSFYILFPISLLYLINYFVYTLKKPNVVLFITSIVLIFYSNLYFSHYLLFGVIAYYIGVHLSLGRIIDFADKYWFIAGGLYCSIFIIFPSSDIGFMYELFMLLIFLFLFLKIGRLVKRINSLVQYITSNSKVILYFYILHVVVLKIAGHYFKLTSLLDVFLFSTVFFIFMLFIIEYIFKCFRTQKVG